MAKVFVSYSRRDIEFAKRLTGELQKSELDFWIDWEGIPPTVDWWKEIEKGIEEADVFLFLISPDSAKSKVCGQEIDCAIKNGKRLIPLIVRDIKADEAPPQLSHLNWIFFRESDDFGAGLNKLLTSIHTDYDWVKTHRRLQMKALEWDRSNKERSFLLHGKDLQDAEFQLATNTSKEPHPTDLQREYVFASRKAADRQKTITTSVATAGAIALAALAVFGFIQAGRATSQASIAMTAQSNAESAQATAVANEQEAKLQKAQAEAEARRAISGQLALESKSALEQYPQRAQLLGVEALQVNLEAGETTRPIAEEALRAANARVTGMGLPGFTKEVSFLQFTRDNRKLLAGSFYSGEFRIWNLDESDRTGHIFSEINLKIDDPNYVDAYLSDQEKWFVVTIEKISWIKLENGSSVSKTEIETYLYSMEAATGAKPLVFQNPVVFLDQDRTVLEPQAGKTQFWNLNFETTTAEKSFVVEGDFAALSADKKILATKIVGPDRAQVNFWSIDQENNSPPQMIDQVEFARGDNIALFVEATSHRLAVGEVSDATTTLHLFDMEDPEQAPDIITLPESNLYYSLQSSPQDTWLKVRLDTDGYGGHSFLINLQTEPPRISDYKINDFYDDFLLDNWYVYLDTDSRETGYQKTTTYYIYRFVDLRKEEFAPDPSYEIADPNENLRGWRLLTDPGGTWLRFGVNDSINTDALVTEGKLVVRTAIPSNAKIDPSDLDPWSSITRTGFEDPVVLSATSPDQRWHAQGSYGGSLRLWNLHEESKYLTAAFTNKLSTMSLSSNGQWLVAGSGLWHLEQGLPFGQPIRFTPFEARETVFSPDGHWILLQFYHGFQADLNLIDIEAVSKNPSKGALMIDLNGLGNPDYVSFSSDSRWLMVVGGSEATGLWDLANPQPSPALLLPEGNLAEVVFTPDDKYMLGLRTSDQFASSDVSSDVFVWEYPVSQAKQVNKTRELNIRQASQISQNGYWLIARNNQLWDLRCLIQNVSCEPFSLDIPEGSSTSFSPDSHYLTSVSTSEQTKMQSYRIWNLEKVSGIDQIAPVLVHNATSSFGWTSTIWDIKQPITGRIYLSEGVRGEGFGEPGSYKIDYGIEVIRPSSGSASFKNLILRGHEEAVTDQMTSPIGRYGITISPDSLKLWDLEALQKNPFAPAVNLPIETSMIKDYGFTMDERFLVILLRSQELKFVPMRVDDLIDQACRSVGRNFIINEWQRYFLDAEYQRTCENLPAHPSVSVESLAIP